MADPREAKVVVYTCHLCKEVVAQEKGEPLHLAIERHQLVCEKIKPNTIPPTYGEKCDACGNLVTFSVPAAKDIAMETHRRFNCPMTNKVPVEEPLGTKPAVHLLSTTDASIWAKEFVTRFGGDEALMLAWFANAIETGRNCEARHHFGVVTSTEETGPVPIRLPNSLHINGRTYPIQTVITHEDVDARYKGRVSHSNGNITLEDGRNPGFVKETLMHELVHIVEQNTGCDLSEKQIIALSNGLFAALRDNPEAANWMLQKE